MLFCSLFFVIMRTILEEVLIPASDRAMNMTLVLLPWKQNANKLLPQFTFGEKSCLENKHG